MQPGKPQSTDLMFDLDCHNVFLRSQYWDFLLLRLGMPHLEGTQTPADLFVVHSNTNIVGKSE